MLVGSLLMPSAKKDLKAKEQTSNIAVHKQVYTNKAESGTGGTSSQGEIKQVSILLPYESIVSNGGHPSVVWKPQKT